MGPVPGSPWAPLSPCPRSVREVLGWCLTSLRVSLLFFKSGSSGTCHEDWPAGVHPGLSGEVRNSYQLVKRQLLKPLPVPRTQLIEDAQRWWLSILGIALFISLDSCGDSSSALVPRVKPLETAALVCAVIGLILTEDWIFLLCSKTRLKVSAEVMKFLTEVQKLIEKNRCALQVSLVCALC